MKRLTFFSLILASIFFTACANDSKAPTTAEEATQEVVKMDSLINDLNQTEQKIEADKKALENALNDLD